MSRSPGLSSPDPFSQGARRIRTFHARHGRVTARMHGVLDELGPRSNMSSRTDLSRPLVVEVGCGFGEAAVAYADANPHVDVVAFDVHTPGVVATLEAAAERDNLFVELGDAVDALEYRIRPGSLQGIHVFFPDPWPKTRHHKRRFIRPDLVELCASRMAEGAGLAFATDVDDYARWAIEHLDEHSAFVGGITSRPSWRPVTRYEAQALDAGSSISDLAYRRVRASGSRLRE